MHTRSFSRHGFFVFLALAACGPAREGDDSGTTDAARDVARDTAVDSGIEAGGDSGRDVAADTADVATDTGTDASHDVAMDIGSDVAVDTGVDAPQDTGVDAAQDTGVDVASDVPRDVPMGGPCTDSAMCATGFVCGFAIADACTATGTCVMQPVGSPCGAITIINACGCDGTTLSWRGGCHPQLPDGYAPGPVRSPGMCSGR